MCTGRSVEECSAPIDVRGWGTGLARPTYDWEHVGCGAGSDSTSAPINVQRFGESGTASLAARLLLDRRDEFVAPKQSHRQLVADLTQSASHVAFRSRMTDSDLALMTISPCIGQHRNREEKRELGVGSAHVWI